MSKTSKTVIFFGNERLATGVTTSVPTLSSLIKSGYHVAAVVSSYQPGRSRNSRELEVQEVARQHNIPLLLNEPFDKILSVIRESEASAGVLVAFGKIVPQEIIDAFPCGIINIHPSLLPLHRGPTPIESAILGGESKTGVSIMKLAAQMDTGPVYGQSEMPLTGNESKQELADHLLEVGSAMLVELLPDILDGSVVALPQDNTRATCDSKISKSDGVIDWHKPAERIAREVRAYSQWPAVRAQIAGKDVIITKASVIDMSGESGKATVHDNQLVVFCTEQALAIQKLKPAGGKEMTAAEFIAGHKSGLR